MSRDGESAPSRGDNGPSLSVQIRKHVLAGVLVILTLNLGAGCENTDPASLMAACVEAMPAGETECDLGRPVWVVAVPGGTTIDVLAEQGVPEPAARAMTRNREREDRWCVIEGETAHFEIACVESRTSIVRASAAYGRRFLVTVGAAGVESIEALGP